MDDLLKDSIKILPTGVSSWKVWCIWLAVDLFGRGPWYDYDEYDKEAIELKLLKVRWGDK